MAETQITDLTPSAPPAWRPVHAARRTCPVAGQRRRATALAAAGALAALAVVAVVVPLAVQLDQRLVDLTQVNTPPSLTHLFGTDELGRDVLLRSVYGLRISLAIGAAAALMSTLVGGAVGLVAAAFGGWVDRALMRVLDGVASLPHLLLGIFIVVLFRGGALPVIAAVALTHWLSTARIVRSEVLSLRERPLVDAAISGGASRWRVVRRHLAPNIVPHVALATVLMLPHAIWHESALSFLGLGLPPHLASLGNMIADGSRSVLAGAWWPSFFPGLAIVAPTLAVSVLGGWLRDRINPRWRSELQL
ncbi:MAG: ABC transporter permease [Egibacteraceae bacterium]